MLGVGAIGAIVASGLVKNGRVEEVRLCDIDIGKCREIAAELKNSKVSAHRVNAGKSKDLLRVAKDADLVINTTLPEFNLTIMDAALKSGVNYQDTVGSETDLSPLQNVLGELKLNEKWEKAGLTALIAAGSAPGTVNVMAANACDEFDRLDKIRFRLFNRVESKEIVSSWSPKTMLEDMTCNPVVYEDGEYKLVAPFSGEETYEFPDPIGSQVVYNHAHSEPITLPRYVGKSLRYVDLKIASPDLPVIKFLVHVGLTSEKPVNLKGRKIVPRDVLLALMPPPLSPQEVIDKMKEGVLIDAYGSYVVEVEGYKGDKKMKQVSNMSKMSLREVSKLLPGATHQSYITGISALIFAEMLLNGDVKTPGLFPPEAMERQARRFSQQISKRGLMVHTKTLDA